VNKQFVRKFSLVMSPLALLILTSCSKETSCGTDIFGKSVKCTESTGPNEGISNFVGRSWVLLLFGGIAAIGFIWDVIEKRNNGKTGVPTNSTNQRPSTVAVADVRPGDLIAGSTGVTLGIREVAWVSATHVKLTYSNGAVETLLATKTLTKLPPPLR